MLPLKAHHIETWCRILQAERIKCGISISVKNLVEMIEDYIDHYNKNPKYFKGAKISQEIMAKTKKSAYAV